MTSPIKKWKRWTEETKQFPRPKYGFNTYLQKVGDSITTHPMEFADYIRIKDAAKFWAYTKGKRVKVKKQNLGHDLCNVTITLISHHRDREYEY